MIRVERLRKSFGADLVLDDVSFAVDRGELLLLLGGNGAGKSTLIRCLLGTLPYEGRIRIDGLDPATQGRRARKRIGYMPQGQALHLDLTVADTLRFYSELRRTPPERGLELVREMDLEDRLRTKVGDLSGGMRQRLQFTLALLDDPPVLLLDEPTASLDDWSRELLVRRVRELADSGKSVLLSTHDRGGLEDVCDRSLTLVGGRLEGRPRGPLTPGSAERPGERRDAAGREAR